MRVIFTPDTAFAAAQILAVLLVATMLDPWSKGSSEAVGTRGVTGRWLLAQVSYAAKVLTVLVLLFDMQIVLFGGVWEGGRAYALAIANYVAISANGLSILAVVLDHMGAFRTGSGIRREQDGGQEQEQEQEQERGRERAGAARAEADDPQNHL